MSGPKLFIIVLVVLAVLFVVGAGAGLRKDGDGNASPGAAPWTQWIQRTLGPEPVPVRSEEIQELRPGGKSFVGNTFLVPPGPKLTYTVRASDQRGRELGLTLTTPGKAGVRWEPRGPGAVPLELPLHPGKRVKFQVPKEGARLTLWCETTSAVPPIARIEAK